jgi:uncharacterized protein YfaS (alpha-2-macroglobulin family)
MRRFLTAVLLTGLAAMPALAETLIPDRRAVVSRDVDFYGADIQPLFDTTQEACQRLCLNDPVCAAFTFNTRSNACFPKSSVEERQPYDGAISAEIVKTPASVIRQGAARAEDLGFLAPTDLEAATEQARGLGFLHEGGEYPVPVLLGTVAVRLEIDDPASALGWQGAALAQTDAADHWVEYARIASMLQDRAIGDEARRHAGRALGAVINGYLRAETPALQVSALMQMARALEAQGRGRATIPALRLAQSLQDNPEVAERLGAAIATHGFRITDTVVESDSAEPRICAEFSEDLVRAGFDYAPYLRLPDATLAVTAEERRLCVTGVVHGERYSLTFRQGLPAASGEVLIGDVAVTLYVRDRAPSVRFPGRSYVLPRTGDAGLPIETVNLTHVDLVLRRVSDRNLLRAIQDRYFGRPLSPFAEGRFSQEIAEEVWRGQAVVERVLNRTMLTRLPMDEAIAGLPAGIYALSAAVPDGNDFDLRATQWFVLSDIGLTSMMGTDGLHVFARSLAGAEALAGLDVTLLSEANRELARVTTDADGYAHFPAGLTRGNGGAAPALVVVEDGGSDVAFLSLRDAAFDLSDRGVAGRAPAGPVDVFLTTDRGAYRAGETIHATVLARDGQARAVEGLPVTAVLTRPDGVEYRRVTSASGVAGGHVFALDLAHSVPRGAWRLAVFGDPGAAPLGSVRVLVEDFVPERIDVALMLPEGPLRAADRPTLEVSVDYLFGAPGADLPVRGSVRMTPLRTLAAHPGYVFGRHDAEFAAPSAALPENVRTDSEGRARIPLPLPASVVAGQLQEAEVVVEVAEGSGRPVERRITRAVAPESPAIGIRPAFDGVVPEGTEAAFDLIALGADLAPVPVTVRWTLNRVTRHYQWFQLYGSWDWEPVTRREAVASGSATLGADPVSVAAGVDWGTYELVVERSDGPYTASSTEFHAGWFAPADTTATPDTLELSLDKQSYRPGETAMLRVVPRDAGTALVSVMSNRLIAMQAVPVGEGENLIPVPVTDDWGAGAYVTASVIRPMDAEAGRNPARALGLSYAAVDPGEKRLNLSLDVAGRAAPRGALPVRVAVEGLADGDTAHVTLAAVDVGILNLTGYQSPDPSGHYFGQRRLGVEIRDLYGRLIDGQTGAMGQIRSGGDVPGTAQLQGPPPTEDLVAFFSGPVTLAPDGTADLSFDLPAFNGTLRLMAVAWSETAVGEAEAEVLVRDPVVISASLPRFLAPGDRSRLALEITHAEGPTGDMALSIAARGLALDPAGVPEVITLGAQETARVTVPVAAGIEGDHGLTVTLTTPDGRVLTRALSLGVRALDPAVARTRRVTLEPGGRLLLDDAVFAGLRRDGAEALVSAGALARFDAPGLIAALDRFPYGCTEQVASRAMPLLYLSQVATAMGLGGQDALDARIAEAVETVLNRQSANGAFGLWYAGSGDFWLDAYVTDFLSRARAEGHAIPERAFQSALDNLQNQLAWAPDFENAGEDVAYALMVLAREGAARVGDLRYYADVKHADFATALAQAQLGAALAFYGDQMRADFLFAAAARRIAGQTGDEPPVFRTDYGSRLRDTAGLLALAVEAGSAAVDRDALAVRVADPGRPMSTQEQSWALLAAHALVSDPDVAGLTVNGAAVSGPFVRSLAGAAPAPAEIVNASNMPTRITLTTLGVPDRPQPAGGYGYAIDRAYFALDGTPVDPAALRVGDRMVAVLTVSPAEEIGARLMIDDPLPAGFEIDNPNLVRAGDIGGLDWLRTAETQYTEFRTERFVAAVDWRGDRPFDLAYVLRAVSPGTFHHPAASVEDMYRPAYRARTETGRIAIAE